MKKFFTFFVLLVFSLGVNAQLAEIIDFETDTDDDLWTIFANGTDSPDDLTIVANPTPNDVNPSDYVLEFKVHPNASPWVGAWSDNFGPMAFTNDEHVLTMMVLKPIISPAALKVEGSTDGGANQELKVENTVTDEWELLTFDLSAAIGFTYPRLVMFPDFPDARSQDDDLTFYIDNIAVEGAVAVKNLSGSPIKTYPNPVADFMYVQHPDMNSISVSNLSGKILKNYKFQTASTKTIETSDLPAGLYLINVESKNGKFVSKFSKR